MMRSICFRTIGIVVCLLVFACTKNDVSDGKPAATFPAGKKKNVADPASNAQKPLCVLMHSLEQLPHGCVENGRYQAVFLNGKKSGYAISGRYQSGDLVENCEFSQIVMKRGALEMRVTSLSNSVETVDGTPVSYEMISAGSGMQKEACGVLKGDKMHIRTTSAGYSSEKTVDWEDGAMMQEGLRLLLKKHGLEKGTQVTGKGFDAESESIISFSYTVSGVEEVDLLGKVARAVNIKTVAEYGASTMETVEWLNDDLETMKSSADVMGMNIETVLCEKEYALSNNSPAEIFTASFIDAPKPLSRKDVRGKLTYTLVPLDKKKLSFPESKEQRITKITEDEIFITVKPSSIADAGAIPYKGTQEMAEYLAPNSWIQSQHADVVALAKKAMGKATHAGTAAKNIERFVSSYISNRSLSVGYASALEVVKSKQGDCTEFALLTAALCRAVGIPARVVFGIVYVRDEFEGHSNFFGGHAWTQVFIDGNWYSLDAAMGKFDAGHLAIDYNDGEPTNFFKLITTMGYFDVTSIK